MNIGWDKAPEGYGFYKEEENRYTKPNGNYTLKASIAEFPGLEVTKRPALRGRYTAAEAAPETWNGEGLPPVGIECEQAPRGVAEHARKVLWRKVRIIAHVEDSRLTGRVAVYVPTEGQANCDQAVAGCFRPIRNAEQIAAEERQILELGACAEIEQKLEGYNIDLDCSAAIRATINAMIEAGYRKVQP